jgi:flagellin
MPLNVVSNYAANVAHRNLSMTDVQASNSLAKLSVGKRVVSARDDAASMAVGQRLNAEVQGLKQATVNSGQAVSMLQIADGAMSTTSDILTRMKVLAIQSSSGNLSATERDFLDAEFQALVSEADRVAQDTDFAGIQLLDGSFELSSASDFAASDGVSAITAQGLADVTTDGGEYTISYTAASDGGTFQIVTAGDGTNADGTYSGSIEEAVVTGTAGALTRATTVTLEGTGTSAGSFTIALNTAFDATADAGDETAAYTGSSSLDLTFKLGTGTATQDSLTFTLDSVNVATLGLTGQTIDTEANANAALEAINSAIDTLNEFRADVGAAQNRLDFASANLNVTIENTEAARSTLMDLDIAAEMTKFSSKQVLMQSGVAMLAQANQMPQNLLRLLQ